MSLSSHGNAFEAMEAAARAENGIRYRVSSYGDAIKFRQMCYQYRKTQQGLAKTRLGIVPGIEASTPYDDIEITLEYPNGTKVPRKPINEQVSIDVVFKHRHVTGQLLSAEGTPITVEPAEPQIQGLDLE